MDRPPAWLRLISTITWVAGMLAIAGSMTVPALAALVAWPPPPHGHLPIGPDSSIVDFVVPTVDASHGGAALDPFLAMEQDIAERHAHRHSATCLLRVGVWEVGRPDEPRVDPILLGSWADPGSRWLDVRRLGFLVEALGDRMALCAAKGFDAVLLSDLDGYTHPTGFPLTIADQVTFNATMIRLAHRYGLRAGVVGTAHTPAPSGPP